MKKVLIIDDEYRIGLLIRTLIHWDELDMENVAVLDNSELALEMILKEHPDIIITDIRMPKIDGLELIRRTLEAGLSSKFIVISGYREFDYAHQALNYGVEDYILKPVNEADLNKTLARIQDKLSAEDQTKDMVEHYRESRQVLRTNLANRIVTKDSVDLPENTILNMSGEFYRALAIKLDYLDYDKRNAAQNEIAMGKIHALTEEIFSECTEEQLLCDKPFLHCYCMINYREEQKTKFGDACEKLLTAIKEYLMGFELYRVTIGVGSEKIQFSELGTSVQEADEALCNRMGLGSGRLICYEDLTCREKDPVIPAMELEEPVLKGAIETLNTERLCSSVEKIFHLDGSLADYNFTYIYESAEQLTELFFRLCPEKDSIITEREDILEEKIHHCSRLRQLVTTMEEEFSAILDRISQRKANESVLPVRLAREYVAEHLSEKIQLETIADVVNLNSVYFSALFKKETGMNFSAYLANERMEAAKKMLVSTNDTIEAIGYACGYNDYKYFCQQFKKLVGVKPNAYRKLYS